MNQRGTLELFQKLGITELNFKTRQSYETIKVPIHQMLLIDGDIYYCKDMEDYESKCEYNWDIQQFTYFYDRDVDSVVIELYAWGTDVVEVETLDQLYAIVRRDFLEANGIKLIFGKEDKDDN